MTLDFDLTSFAANGKLARPTRSRDGSYETAQARCNAHFANFGYRGWYRDGEASASLGEGGFRELADRSASSVGDGCQYLLGARASSREARSPPHQQGFQLHWGNDSSPQPCPDPCVQKEVCPRFQNCGRPNDSAAPKSSPPGGTKFRERAEVTQSSLRERVSQVRVAGFWFYARPARVPKVLCAVVGPCSVSRRYALLLLIFSIGERMTFDQRLGQRRYAAASFTRSFLD